MITKKLLTGFLSLTITFSAYTQQQPENAGFENWETISGLTVPEPVDWSSIKTSQNSTLNGLAPYVWDQSTDSHSGNYSVKLYTVAGPFGITATGAITNGRVNSSITPSERYMYTDVNNSQWHTPLSERPDSVVVWAKFSPVGADVAMVRTILHTGFAKIPDVNKSNWIAEALIEIPASTPTWTRFSAPFVYINNNAPAYILFVMSSGGDSPNIGSTVFFDDVELIYNEPELDLTAYLQGPYIGGNQMSTSLNPELLPLSQPFNTAPWNYNGTESVPNIPNAAVVDWVLVDMRDAASAATATAATLVKKSAAFLLSDGSVVGMDGSGRLTTPLTINQNLYVVIWHRNHLGIMSANALVKVNGVYSYNFSDTPTKIYGTLNGFSQLETGDPGLWGMSGGDGNADGIVNDADKNSFWSLFVGKTGYLSGDYNLDGQINNPDKNDLWLNNQTKATEVPD